MIKPTMKREIGIAFVSKSQRIIHFFATNDATAELLEFGHVRSCGDAYPSGQMALEVDPRFDFEEVHEWMANYGNQ